MDWLPNALRITLILLAISYLPLLYLRIKRTETLINVVHLLGTGFFVIAVILGSVNAYGSTFHYSQPLFLIGMFIVFTNGVVAERTTKNDKKR